MGTLETEYCVIGTGAGGGIVAHTLAERGYDVLSIEQGPLLPSGRFENELRPEQATDFGIKADMTFPIGEIDIVGNELYADQAECSSVSTGAFEHRQIFAVGGLQNLWGGGALRFSQSDLEDKSYADVRWPLTYTDLAPHYASVERLAPVCGEINGIGQFPDGEFIDPLPQRRADILVQGAVKKLKDPSVFTFPARKTVETRTDYLHACKRCGVCVHGCRSQSMYSFPSRLLQDLRKRQNYRLQVNVKAIGFDGEGSRIHALQCVDTVSNERFQVKAKRFVLAAGTIETARILLNSGISAQGNVGQFLQDGTHVVLSGSLLRLWNTKVSANPGYGEHTFVGGTLPLRDESRFGFVGAVFHNTLKYPIYLPQLQPYPRPFRKYLAKKIFRSIVSLVLFGPSEPKRKNCIVLTDEKDKYGVPKASISYRKTDLETEFEVAMGTLGRRLLSRASGIGITALPNPPGSAIHYCGTCRAGRRPEEGVVDSNLKVFGYDNLYICDGSVIPKLPEKHLTLTIMALAHRLGSSL